MKPPTTLPLGCAILALLLATGCDDSISPLAAPTKASPDRRLIGLWRHENNGSATYYHVGLLGGDAPAAVMRIVTVTHDGSGELHQPGQAIVFPTDIAGNSYVNVAGADEERIAMVHDNGWKAEVFDSYFILKYRVDGDLLLAWMMNNEAKMKLIRSGQVKGEIKGDGTPAKFTDTTGNLARLVTAEGDNLFSSEPLRFQRIR